MICELCESAEASHRFFQGGERPDESYHLPYCLICDECRQELKELIEAGEIDLYKDEHPIVTESRFSIL